MNNHTKAPVITLDGPSGTGKGTICHLIANHLGWHILDSGSIYRVLALAARRKNIDFKDTESLVKLANSLNLRFKSGAMLQSSVILDEKDVYNDIRSEECGQDASLIAVIPEVRAALLERQRAFAVEPGLVTDGRDMGTVVFPDAILKLYLYASPEERASRRYFQLKDKGIHVSLAEVVEELAKRDARDSQRQHAPLKPAEDAVLVDTTGLTIGQVFDRVLDLIKKNSLVH